MHVNLGQNKIRLAVLSLYAMLMVYGLFSLDFQYKFRDIIAGLVIYRQWYETWYAISFLLLLALPLFQGRKVLNFIVLFITTFIIVRIVFKNFPPMYLGDSVLTHDSMLAIFVLFLMLFNVIKPLGFLTGREVFFITIPAVMLAFLPNLISIFIGCAR